MAARTYQRIEAGNASDSFGLELLSALPPVQTFIERVQWVR